MALKPRNAWLSLVALSLAVAATTSCTSTGGGYSSGSGGYPAASVKPGGRVVWTNNTSVLHTVTSN